MSYNQLGNNRDPRFYHKPNILFRDDNFLTPDEISKFHSLMHSNTWVPVPNLKKIQLFSKSIYQNYQWNGDWDYARWLDDTPSEWCDLYDKVAERLPKHYVHWIDIKITPPMSTGAPLHRDKDPWFPGGSDKFSKALTCIVNLNSEWDDSWGGDFVLWDAQLNPDYTINFEEYCKVPIKPGQLVIIENAWHSIATITELDRSRISFILQVLQYNNV